MVSPNPNLSTLYFYTTTHCGLGFRALLRLIKLCFIQYNTDSVKAIHVFAVLVDPWVQWLVQQALAHLALVVLESAVDLIGLALYTH